MMNNTINNTDINKVVEETNYVVGDTKMLKKITKEITVAFQIHKELKKAEVEGIFTMPGVTFEVKRRTVYATKEISSYSEEWAFEDLCKKWDFEEEAGKYILDTMEALYIEKCHVYAAEFERKAIIEEAARIAKLKEDGLIDIEVEEENNNNAVVGDTEMLENENIENVENNVTNLEETVENCFFSNNIFYYDWENGQSVYVENDNYPFHNGYHYEQETEIYGDNFFNSVLLEQLKEYEIYGYKSGSAIVFKNPLEDEEQEFEETPGYMVLVETQKKIAKMLEGYPVEEIFKIKEENETLFQGLIDYYYDS